MERKIIHLNIADFGVAVERLHDSSLKQQPLILAGKTARAVVYDMSDEAYRDGVRKGMPLTLARRRCRKARILSPRPDRYAAVMQRCVRHAHVFTPLVEQAFGSGHLYLDVTGTHRLHGPAPDVGWRIRKTLRRDLGLDPIWSVAPNKLVAKVASRLVKPVGEYIVAEGEEESFLAPLPIFLLPGINRDDLQRLRDCNVLQTAQALALSLSELTVLCGGRSRFLYQVVRGIDPSPVQPRQETGNSLVFRHHFAEDCNREDMIRAALRSLVRQAVYSLGQKNRACRKVALRLQYTDGIVVRRQISVKIPIYDDAKLDQTACTVLDRAWKRRVRLRNLQLFIDGLVIPARQLSLFDRNNEAAAKRKKISAALNRIHARCGAGLVHRGALAGSS